MLKYEAYIPADLREQLLAQAKPVAGGLSMIGQSGGLESEAGLKFLSELYVDLKEDLKKVLAQREADRKFIDERIAHADVIGLEDANGRKVIGPLKKDYYKASGKEVAEIPEYLKGPHVTLFGPPDSAKMAINAMNSYHRKLKDEPAIVEELLNSAGTSPKWGADDEDSKTPLHADLIDAGVNLTACFDHSIKVDNYQLKEDHLAQPIKRFPGLALPSTFLFHGENPIPLHLYDFALHFFKNWKNPESLVFYVPKLENEEEAKYIHKMMSLAEEKIKKLHPEYKLATIRLLIVLENPRAILRTNEIMDALYPYFVGASLGWHDYLASTARLNKNNANYRIPVKADPDIVIKYIQASHLLLADVVGARGGIKIGGMYGILPLTTEIKSESFQITLKGFIRDVIVQMKRDLTGFWVAHPDFVRLGLAFVEAWKFHKAGKSEPLFTLVKSLLDQKYHEEIISYIEDEDVRKLNPADPNYVKSLIVTDIKESDFIPNNHPDEIRYNVFQSLQYLTDWLCGNGCVALPATVNKVAVRVMDDLATAERSRWEVWHEINHGRFSVEEFLKIAHEELHFIRKDLSNDEKIVQVKWNETTAKWYPIAMRIMIKLMTDKNPPEFATELLMRFTVDSVRENPLKIELDPYVERFNFYFEACGSISFATEMAKLPVMDLAKVRECILNFSMKDILEAASFHGNIGENKKTLDQVAAFEQALVSDGEALQKLGEEYLQKFGFKFLISAKGKSAEFMLNALRERMKNSKEREIINARLALEEITLKRLIANPLDQIKDKIESLQKKYKIDSVGIAINENSRTQSLFSNDWFELASLSKTLASGFAIEYFKKKNIPLDTSVDDLFAKTASKFRLNNQKVTLEHLMNHSALSMHYVPGTPLGKEMPKLYEKVEVLGEPGKKFQYSGGGFLVLEHLIESMEGKSVQELTKNLFEDISFEQEDLPRKTYAQVPGGRLKFPAFAAGAMGSAAGMAKYLNRLSDSYKNLNDFHDTAVEMLHGTDKGCRDFMGCDMGLGVFVAEAGDNKFAIHQGANDGYRCLYLQCFDGPDVGKGFVILCNADNEGVLFISEVAQILLKDLNFKGIDFSKFKSDFDFKNLKQEQIVNLGYKNLVFSAFLPTLPEEITHKGEKDPNAAFNLVVGAKILSCSNQKFARAENLISDHLPIFEPELFGRQGKIMDSWESARHNQQGYDKLVLELKKPSEVNFVSLSTKYHDGNQVEYVRITGDDNFEILPRTKLHGHSLQNIKLKPSGKIFTKIQVEVFPDGGLSRLGLFKEAPPGFKEMNERFSESIPKSKKPLTLPFDTKNNKVNVIKSSNEHYGPAAQVVSPYPPIHMFDGLESARSRKADHFEETIFEFDQPTQIKNILMDFTYFVNNNPMFVSIDGLIPKTKVKAFAGNKKLFKVDSKEKFKTLTLRIYPDGGINRIRFNVSDSGE